MGAGFSVVGGLARFGHAGQAQQTLKGALAALGLGYSSSTFGGTHLLGYMREPAGAEAEPGELREAPQGVQRLRPARAQLPVVSKVQHRQRALQQRQLPRHRMQPAGLQADGGETGEVRQGLEWVAPTLQLHPIAAQVEVCQSTQRADLGGREEPSGTMIGVAQVKSLLAQLSCTIARDGYSTHRQIARTRCRQPSRTCAGTRFKPQHLRSSRVKEVRCCRGQNSASVAPSRCQLRKAWSSSSAVNADSCVRGVERAGKPSNHRTEGQHWELAARLPAVCKSCCSQLQT